MPNIIERFKRSWNAFTGRDPTWTTDLSGYGYRQDKVRFRRGNAQSVVGFIYNRIAIDVAAVEINHVRTDEDGRFKEIIKDDLNERFTLEANLDQTSRNFFQDIAQSMFDEGVVAVVPVECETNATHTMVVEGKIYSLRTGKITAWYPTAVRVEVYNERTGCREEVILPKTLVAIIENPFYTIMNEPNSTLQQLLRTIGDLNAANAENTSGKLDLIIQLPYVIKSELRRKEAMKRRQEIEDQLNASKYGVAYTDGTERIVQLNRSLENNLWQQVKDLTDQLYNQLGLTASIFDGTADEAAMINYNNRAVEPVVAAIVAEFRRKWLSKTARTQLQDIQYFRDPFKLVPVSQLAEIADKFTRNEILSSNEVRAEIGYKPVDNARANELRNKNINTSNLEMEAKNEFGNTADAETPNGPDEAESVDEFISEIAKIGSSIENVGG